MLLKSPLTGLRTMYMQANPDKFQAMVLSRNDVHMDFNVNGTIIKCDDVVKLLGCYLDKKLTFENHVSHLCKKSAKQLNVLRRLSKVLDHEGLLKIYDAFFASNFNYCPVLYHSCGKGNARKIEKLYERALKLVCNTQSSTYQELLEKTSKTSMYNYRVSCVMEQVFKIMHSLYPPIPRNPFNKKSVNYNLRNSNILVQPKVNTVKFGLNSFKYEGTVLWNSYLRV